MQHSLVCRACFMSFPGGICPIVPAGMAGTENLSQRSPTARRARLSALERGILSLYGQFSGLPLPIVKMSTLRRSLEVSGGAHRLLRWMCLHLFFFFAEFAESVDRLPRRSFGNRLMCAVERDRGTGVGCRQPAVRRGGCRQTARRSIATADEDVAALLRMRYDGLRRRRTRLVLSDGH